MAVSSSVSHKAWCPWPSNPRPQPKRIAKGVVLEWHPYDPPFDCLCGALPRRATPTEEEHD